MICEAKQFKKDWRINIKIGGKKAARVYADTQASVHVRAMIVDDALDLPVAHKGLIEGFEAALWLAGIGGVFVLGVICGKMGWL